MRNCVIYADGSRVLKTPSKRKGLECKVPQNSTGWALVALHDDAEHEVYGAFDQKVEDNSLSGYHEHLAITHAALYAHDHGFDFERVTLHTDDDVFGYAQTWLHPENYMGGRADHVKARLAHVVAKCFKERPEAYELTLKLLTVGTVHKIKGHKLNIIYHERCDYLARWAATYAKAPRSPQSMHNWLKAGFHSYVYEDKVANAPKRVVVYAPFVASLQESAVAV